MQEVTTNRSIDEVLLELEQVLSDERTALVSLEATSIDALNIRKIALQAELALFAREHFVTRADRLSSLRRQLQENLVLLVHARDVIQHRLGIEPAPIATHRASVPANAGSRLNLRG